jgi:hypothetical protein
METFIQKTPFTNLQRELLTLFAREVPENQLLEIKERIARFLIEQSIKEADAAWDEQGYTAETAHAWAHEHR